MGERITLNKRYEIIGKIGDGGMAEVFHGFDALLHRDVSVKILRDQYLQDKSFVARFRQEAYAAASLSHPNIVSVYDVGQEHGIQYIVLEYIVGRSLKECIDENGALDYKTAIKYASGVASALTHAHSKNLVHCDVKSHNILIDTKGVAKITDFGIAKAVGESNIVEHKKEVMGSVYYLSPEQAKGGKVSPQSDVYSLGVVLFEMLTGTLPFKGDTPAEVACQHLNCPTPSVREFDPEIPLDLAKIVAKALAKNPLQRYGSAQELYQDLKQAEALLYSDEDNTKRVQGPLLEDKHLPEEAYVSDETMVVKKDEILRGLATNGPDKKEEILPTPKKPPHTKKILAYFMAAIGILACLIYGFSEYSKASIVVPDLKDKSIVEAEEILTELNLTYGLSEEYDPLIKPGRISSQKPGANSKVKEGRKIRLVISKGAEPGVVPDVTQKNLGDATVLLQNAQLEVGKVTVKYDKNAKQGIVLKQSLKPGEKMNPGGKVDLVVNIGEGQTVIPSLRGMYLADVKDTLDSLGLKLGTVTKAPSKDAKGTVISMEQTSGDVVEKGEAVNITLSLGEETPKAKTSDSKEASGKAVDEKKNNKQEPKQQGSAKPNDNQAKTAVATQEETTKFEEFIIPGKGKHTVRVVLSDGTNLQTVYSGTVDGGARVRQTVTSGSGSSLKFYVDEKLVEDRKL